LMHGNVQQVLSRLDEGLRTSEHEEFVRELAARKQAPQP
jgi:hypothetical protein